MCVCVCGGGYVWCVWCVVWGGQEAERRREGRSISLTQHCQSLLTLQRLRSDDDGGGERGNPDPKKWGGTVRQKNGGNSGHARRPNRTSETMTVATVTMGTAARTHGCCVGRAGGQGAGLCWGGAWGWGGMKGWGERRGFGSIYFIYYELQTIPPSKKRSRIATTAILTAHGMKVAPGHFDHQTP